MGSGSDSGSGSSDGSMTLPTPDGGIPDNLPPCEAAAYHEDLAFIQQEVFDRSCTTNCHAATATAGGLNLSAGASRASLVNVPSTQFSGWVRVSPGNPGASMLMVQLGGEPGPELEGTMPWNQPKLCDPLIDSIRRWIAAGAQP